MQVREGEGIGWRLAAGGCEGSKVRKEEEKAREVAGTADCRRE